MTFDIIELAEFASELEAKIRNIASDANCYIAMGLPEGKTCNDCVHCRRCCLMFGHIPEDEVCDFYPSRYRPMTHNPRLDQRNKS